MGRIQLRRYLGILTELRHKLYIPLKWQQEVDPEKIKLFLLHWPGPAGGLGEKVEFRSRAHLQELRETPNWGTCV